MRPLALALFVCLCAFSLVAATSVDPAVAVQNLTLTSGRLRVTIASGSAAKLKNGAETVGVFVKGSGTFQYVTTDPVEFALAKTNLKMAKSKATVTGDDKSLTISGNVSEVAWYGSELPALTGASATSIEQDFAAHQAFEAQMHGRSALFLLNERKLIAPSATAVQAELRGDEEWVYRFDDVDEHAESFAKLCTINFDDRTRRSERFSSVVSEVPIGRDRRQPPPVAATMTAVDYSITEGSGGDAKVTVKESIVPRVDGARAIPFTLDQLINVGDGKPARHLELKSLKVDGAKGDYLQENEHLLVQLPAPATAGKPIAIEAEIAGDFLIHPEGDNYWLLEEGWYPELPFPERAFTTHGVIRTKAPWVPFAGGKTISRRKDGDFNVLETAIEEPVNFLVVIAGKYDFEEEKRDNLTIRTASYGQKNTRAIRQLTGLAFDIIHYYEYFLGPFPVDELNIVQVNSLGFGQAPPGLLFITNEAFQPLMGHENQFFTDGVNERFAHEIAHQYWGGAVKMTSGEDEWLNESFAEYSAALLLKKFKGDGDYNRLVAHWKAGASSVSSAATIPMANRLFSPNTAEDFQNRTWLLYGKGPYLLAALHKDVGDQMFLTFLKSYQKSFHGKFGTTKDVAGLLAFMTKKDYKPFFESYYYGTAMP